MVKKYIVDLNKDEKIRVVLDNLNTHSPAAGPARLLPPTSAYVGA